MNAHEKLREWLLVDWYEAPRAEIRQACDDFDRLVAENARLREALDKILAESSLLAAQFVAANALEQKEPK